MHRKGIHCASTAMTDALRVQGFELAEEQAFGLGAGLGFSLHDGDTSLTPPQPGRFFIGRSATFEHDLCDALGVRLREKHFASAREATLQPHDLLYTDLIELPYVGAHGHWFGHVVMVGDIGRDQIQLWDNEQAEPQPISREQLAKALCEAAPVQRGPGVTVLHVESAPAAVPEGAARKAILKNARQMTRPASPGEGLRGLEQLVRELDGWRHAPDWHRRGRMAFQVIEKRGCGGGFFRRLYARFLETAAPALAPLCWKAADAWTTFAEKMDTSSVAACLEAERALWSRALEVCA
jgi:hypothetical protein